MNTCSKISVADAPQLFCEEWWEESVEKVKKIVQQLRRRYGLPSHLIDDFVSCGLTSLSECNRKFKPELSANGFWGFAFVRIRGAVIDFARRERRMQADYLDDLYAGKMRQDTKRLLETILDEVYETTKTYMSTSQAIKEMHEDSETAALWRCDLKRMLFAIRALPVREQRLMVNHYFLDKSFKEIIDSGIGVKKSRISKMHRSALNQMKVTLLKRRAKLNIEPLAA